MNGYPCVIDQGLSLAVEETLRLTRDSIRSRVSPVSALLEVKMRQRHWERFCNALIATMQHFPPLSIQRLNIEAERRALDGVIPYYEDALELSLPPLYRIAALLAEIEGYRWVEEARQRAASLLTLSRANYRRPAPVSPGGRSSLSSVTRPSGAREAP